jgi:type VI secretion system secreted protein Hcp
VTGRTARPEESLYHRPTFSSRAIPPFMESTAMPHNQWIKATNDIKGSGKDAAHPDEIAVTSWQWAASQPSAGEAATTGNFSSGNANFAPFVFTHEMDMASPPLHQALAEGKKIDKMEFFVNRRDGAGAEVPYIKYVFENCFIEQITPNGMSDTIPTETVAVQYEKFGIIYQETATDTPGATGNVTAGWDRKANIAYTPS